MPLPGSLLDRDRAVAGLDDAVDDGESETACRDRIPWW